MYVLLMVLLLVPSWGPTGEPLTGPVGPQLALYVLLMVLLLVPSWRCTSCWWFSCWSPAGAVRPVDGSPVGSQLALYVLSFLEAGSLLRAAQTCRYWRVLAEDNLLWRDKCHEEAIDEALVFGGRLLRRRGANGVVVPPTAPTPGGATAGTSSSKSPWKHLYLRQKQIEYNWKTAPLRPPRVGGVINGASSLGHHHWGIITGASSLGHHHWGVITGALSLGRHHWGIITGVSSLGHHHWGVITGVSSLGHHHWGIITGASSLGRCYQVKLHNNYSFGLVERRWEG